MRRVKWIVALGCGLLIAVSEYAKLEPEALPGMTAYVWDAAAFAGVLVALAVLVVLSLAGWLVRLAHRTLQGPEEADRAAGRPPHDTDCQGRP